MSKNKYKNSRQYSKIRTQNKKEILEDYVEAISDLIKSRWEARNTDLASHFGVSKPTINKNIKRLVSLKLVDAKPYRSIFLTDKGMILAEQSKDKHEIVLNFLLKLGISKKIAQEDSEGIEHHVSSETLSIMKKYIKK